MRRTEWRGAGSFVAVADQRTLDAYAARAVEFTDRTRLPVSPLARYFPIAFRPESRVIDVGAATGREVAALLSERFDAYGVEPVETLRNLAIERTGPGRIFAGALPNLGVDGQYDGLLCSAVLQHVPRSQLFDAVLDLRGLLKEHGRALVSVPAGRRPDVGEDERDDWGRLFTALRPEELQLLFERVGFSTLARWEDADSLQRPGVGWVTFLFELGSASGSRPIDQLATVISTKERKVATYKLALLRALNDIAMTQPHVVRWTASGDVEVPIVHISARWIHYYWRLFDAPRFLPQQQGEEARQRHVLGFAKELDALRNHFKRSGGLRTFALQERQGLSGPPAQLHAKLLKKLQHTIFAGPVTYAGGALKTGRLFQKAGDRVVVPGGLWRELSLLGHWIGDALVLRWAELVERLSGHVTAGEVIDHLLPLPEFERDTDDVRALFVAGARCVWTDRSVSGKQLQIDHVLPWALWHNNDLWNLVPAAASVNNSKSDQLPERRFLKSRRSAFREAWSASQSEWPERFRRDAEGQLGRTLGKNETAFEELFDVVTEAVERTRLQRGLGEWQPS